MKKAYEYFANKHYKNNQLPSSRKPIVEAIKSKE